MSTAVAPAAMIAHHQAFRGGAVPPPGGTEPSTLDPYHRAKWAQAGVEGGSSVHDLFSPATMKKSEDRVAGTGAVPTPGTVTLYAVRGEGKPPGE